MLAVKGTVAADGFHVNYAFARVAALCLAFVWNFLRRRYLLFKPTPQAQECPA